MIPRSLIVELVTTNISIIQKPVDGFAVVLQCKYVSWFLCHEKFYLKWFSLNCLQHIALILAIKQLFLTCFCFLIFVLIQCNLFTSNSRSLFYFLVGNFLNFFMGIIRRTYCVIKDFRRVSGDLLKTLWKLCVSTKFHIRKLRETTAVYALTCSVPRQLSHMYLGPNQTSIMKFFLENN